MGLALLFLASAAYGVGAAVVADHSRGRVGNAGSLRVSGSRSPDKTVDGVSPPLDPLSHKQFFGNDYPHDAKPAVHSDFDFRHPYPMVQHSDEFDNDFTKDDNSDSGEWKVQMEYDALRSKMQQAKDAAEAKKRILDQERRDLEEAHRELEEAEMKARHAEARSDSATAAAKVSKEKMPADSEEESESQKSREAAAAAAKVEEEMKDLERCQKELAEAKEKLKALMDEQAKRKHQNAGEKDDAEEVAEDRATDAEQEAVDALEQAKRKASEEQDTAARVARQKEEYEAAARHYQEEVAQVEAREREIAAARERLRALREGQAGGVDSDRQHSSGVEGCKCPATSVASSADSSNSAASSADSSDTTAGSSSAAPSAGASPSHDRSSGGSPAGASGGGAAVGGSPADPQPHECPKCPEEPEPAKAEPCPPSAAPSPSGSSKGDARQAHPSATASLMVPAMLASCVAAIFA